MDRNHQRIGIVNWVLLLVGAVVGVVLARFVNSASAWVTSGILGLGFLIALTGHVQMRLEERERIEKLEFDELNKAKGSSALFSSEADAFAARRSREQFERFFIPGFTLILFLAEVAGVYFGWRHFETAPALNKTGAMIGVSIFGLFFLLLYLLGKYSMGLVRLEKQRLLQPGAGFLLLGAYTCLFVVGGTLLVEAGFVQADLWLARILLVVVGLIALEALIGLVFEAYRPRVKGRVARLLYDSRLVGILGQPESVFTTAAHALDYQFGFKVSDTWFYQFLQRSIVGLVLVQVGVLIVSTSVVFIGPGEQGLLERFGRPVEPNPGLDPGGHFKFPWPIDAVRVFKTKEIQSFVVGVVPDPDREKEKVVLWNIAHNKEEYNLLVASREQNATTNTDTVAVNLLTVSIPVQYQISDVARFAYQFGDAGELLEKIATREVGAYLVGVDLNEIMSEGRSRAGRELLERIQAHADRRGLGVKIIFVGLQDIHPPVKIAESFQEVLGAEQEIQAQILKAEGLSNRMVLLASAESVKAVNEARTFQANRVSSAMARAGQFTNQLTAFSASPRVYPQRLYLETFARATEGTRKYVIASTNSSDVIQVNLEDKFRTDLEDVTVTTGVKK